MKILSCIIVGFLISMKKIFVWRNDIEVSLVMKLNLFEVNIQKPSSLFFEFLLKNLSIPFINLIDFLLFYY